MGSNFTKIFSLFIGIALIGLSAQSDVYAQSALFSQYHQSPMLSNPSEIVEHHVPYISLNYRNHPLSPGDVFHTAMISVLYPLIKDDIFTKTRLGLGASYYSDIQPDFLNTQALSVALAYRLKLSQNFIWDVAMKGSLLRQQIDFSRLTTESLISDGFNRGGLNQENLNSEPFTSFYTGGGMTLTMRELFLGGKPFTENLKLGISLNNYQGFRKPIAQDSKLPWHAQLFIESDFEITNNFKFTPSLRIVKWQFVPITYSIGGNWSSILMSKYFQFGFWYNTNQTLTALIGLEDTKYAFYLSSDLAARPSTRDLTRPSTTELTLALKISKKKNNTQLNKSIELDAYAGLILDEPKKLEMEQAEIRRLPEKNDLQLEEFKNLDFLINDLQLDELSKKDLSNLAKSLAPEVKVKLTVYAPDEATAEAIENLVIEFLANEGLPRRVIEKQYRLGFDQPGVRLSCEKN